MFSLIRVCSFAGVALPSYVMAEMPSKFPFSKFILETGRVVEVRALTATRLTDAYKALCVIQAERRAYKALPAVEKKRLWRARCDRRAKALSKKKAAAAKAAELAAVHLAAKKRAQAKAILKSLEKEPSKAQVACARRYWKKVEASLPPRPTEAQCLLAKYRAWRNKRLAREAKEAELASKTASTSVKVEGVSFDSQFSPSATDGRTQLIGWEKATPRGVAFGQVLAAFAANGAPPSMVEFMKTPTGLFSESPYLVGWGKIFDALTPMCGHLYNLDFLQKLTGQLPVNEIEINIVHATFLKERNDFVENFTQTSETYGWFSSLKSLASGFATCLSEDSVELSRDLMESAEEEVPSSYKRFVESAKTAGRFVGAATLIGFDKVKEKIWARLMSLFDATLGKWASRAKRTIDTFKSYLATAKSWVEEACNNFNYAVAALKNHIFTVLCIVVFLGIIHMCERALFRLGIIHSFGVAAGTFLSIFLAAFGVLYLSNSPNLFRDMKNQFINLLEGCFGGSTGLNKTSKSVDESSTYSIMEALYAPVNLLSSVGESLYSVNTNTVVYFGKLGSSMEGIRKGINCVKDAAAFAVESLAGIFYKLTGRECTFFAEISALTRHDLKGWIARSEKALLDLEIMRIRDRGMLDALTLLVRDGKELRTAMIEHDSSRLSASYLRITSDILKQLEEKRREVAYHGDPIGRRLEPFWLYLYGPSHCGKSNVMNYFAGAMLDHMGHSKTDCLSLTPTDKYFSGYERQTCIKIDDLSCVKGERGASMESTLVNMVTSAEYRPVMASLEEKGMLFDSPLIVSTSNHFDAPPDSDFTCREAYQNRRAIVLECRRACETDQVVQVPDEPLTTVMCRWVNKNNASAMEGTFGQWQQAVHCVNFVLEHMDTHFDKEMAYQQKWKREAGMKHPIFLEAETVLLRENRLNMLGNLLDNRPNFKSAIAVDGDLYCFPMVQDDCPDCVQSQLHCKLNQANVYKGHKLKSSQVEKTAYELEEHYMRMLRMNRVTEQEMFSTSNPIIYGFLRSLVQKDVRVEAVKKPLTGNFSPCQQDFWENLPLAEQAYLRLVQKRVDEIRTIPKAAIDVHIPRCIEGVRKAANWLWENSGKIFVLLMALIVVYTLGQVFLKLFAALVCGKAGVETLSTLDTFSIFPSSSIDAQSYRARNTPLNYRSHTYSGNVGDPSKEYPISMLVGLHTPQGQFISCIRGRNRSILLTRHQAKLIPIGTKLRLSYRDCKGVTSSFSIIWEPMVKERGGTRYGLFEYSDTEVVVYRHPSLSPIGNTNASYFVDDYEAMMTPYPELKFVGLKLKKFGHAEHLRVEDDTPVCHMWNGSGVVCYEKHKLTTTQQDGTVSYVNNIPKFISSTTPVGPEDCGTIVTTDLVINNQKRQVIVGMVVGGRDDANGKRKAAIAFIPDFNCSETFSSFAFTEEAGVEAEGVSKLGFIPCKRDQPNMPTKTAYQKVPEDLQLPMECKKAPAILTKGDERLIGTVHENFDPIVSGPSKYAKPMKELPQDLLEETASEILKDWQQYLNQPLELVSLSDAINGIEGEEYIDKMVENTSEGYPYILSRKAGEKGKGRFLEFDPSDPKGMKKRLIPGCVIESDLERLLFESRDRIPELICIDTPKDELLPLRKIFDTPKTRLFSICPFTYNLALRQYTLRLVAFLQTNRRVLASQVGIVPQSQDWDNLYERLCRMNATEAYNCDYSGFDGYLTSQVLEVIAGMFNSMYTGESQNSQAVRHNLIMALVNRKVIMGSQVYEVRAGLPSGFALTVTINSIFNELLVRMAFKVLAPSVYRNSFHQFVFLATYGDDNVLTIEPNCTYFNGTMLKQTLSDWGVIITDGSDKTSLVLKPKPLAEIDFLKRSFRTPRQGENDGLGVVAPLAEDAIYSCLHWYKPVGSEITTLIDSVRASLYELRLHKNRPAFESLRNFYLERRPYLKEQHVLPDWDEATVLHLDLKGKGTPYKPYKVLDFKLDIPRLEANMKGKDDAKWCHAVERGVSIAGNRYRPDDTRDLFFVACGCAYPPGSAGVRIPITYSHEGVGRQPTQRWGKLFASPKGAGVLAAREAHKDGKTIVFMSEGPYVAAWISLIYFCEGAQIAGRDQLLELFRRVKSPGLNDLSCYFEEFRPRYKGLGKNFFIHKGYLDADAGLKWKNDPVDKVFGISDNAEG
uniref:RNA1 polyprotein n=1 Tax=Paris mosaic virus 1 TaxID=3064729 RepID=A0AA49K476_9SECO|nr:polyprotein [Paris mosaic virus 1]